MRRWLGYLGCAWSAVSECLLLLGLLVVVHVIDLSMLLISMLIVLGIVIVEIVLIARR